MPNSKVFHDLSQPLVAMLGFVQLLRQDWETMGPEERNRLLEIVESEGQRLSEMLTVLAVREVEQHTSERPSGSEGGTR